MRHKQYKILQEEENLVDLKNLVHEKGPVTMEKGAVVELGLRYAPGACVVVGSNPTGPTIHTL